MRASVSFAMLVALAAVPAAAQTSTPTPMHHHPHHRPARSSVNASSSSGNGPPIDHGPYTPEANGAYQGGGMVLEGAPGAPPPRAEPTPPGQTPRNMVPQ